MSGWRQRNLRADDLGWKTMAYIGRLAARDGSSEKGIPMGRYEEEQFEQMHDAADAADAELAAAAADTSND